MSASASERGNQEEKENDVEMKEEEEEEPTTTGKQHALLTLADSLFLLSLPSSVVSDAERKELESSVLKEVKEKNMAPFYKYLGESHGWKLDAALLASMEASNKEALTNADAKIQEARDVAGDTEVRDAMAARAELFVTWGSRDAYDELDKVFEKTVGIASKVDVLLSKMRVALAFKDLTRFKTDMEKAKGLIEQGGDWERKNQLSVYEAIYLIITRQFRDASKLLLDAIATFTTTELFSYTTFVLYTCLLALISVDRTRIQKDLLKSPEILAVLDDIPHLRSLLTSLYKCEYASFFRALSAMTPRMDRSIYLAPHVKFYLRELRVVAYTQFLASYKAASLHAMAQAFGVSAQFMDDELFRFISAGRIHAKIDKVSSVIDTNRPDRRNAMYTSLVKDGDALLNRLQKLSKVISL